MPRGKAAGRSLSKNPFKIVRLERDIFVKSSRFSCTKSKYKKTAKQAKTYSPAKQIAVPSALEGLTSGFGMGPGGPPPLFSPASTALSKLTKRFPLLRFPLSASSFQASHLLQDSFNSTNLKQVKASTL